MEPLLKKILEASGVSGYESEISEIMYNEFKRASCDVEIDCLGNVIAKKGKGKIKIMLAAHMDEVGLIVKNITKEGFIGFIKVGGIDDRILLGQRVVIKNKNKDVLGIIGIKPIHLQKEEEKNKPINYQDMFIDIGAKDKAHAESLVSIGDPVIFEPNSGILNGNLYYGKAVDDRVGCFCLIKIMERLNNIDALIYAVATTQEEVGLKGARTSSFKISPDYAFVIDTNIAGDTPQITEKESNLKLGEGVGIPIIEASGRGLIVNEKLRNILIETAKKNNIKYQVAVIEGGMTDGAIIYINKEGIPTGVLSIPTRYVHTSTSVFSMDDLNCTIELATKTIEELSLR